MRKGRNFTTIIIDSVLLYAFVTNIIVRANAMSLYTVAVYCNSGHDV